jgi:hypothetical protein
MLVHDFSFGSDRMVAGEPVHSILMLAGRLRRKSTAVDPRAAHLLTKRKVESATRPHSGTSRVAHQ